MAVKDASGNGIMTKKLYFVQCLQYNVFLHTKP